MKNKLYISLLSLVLLFSITSCEDYVTVQPTGYLIPEKVEDFDAFLENTMNIEYNRADQALLVGEVWTDVEKLVEGNYQTINYLWQENEDRTLTLESDPGYNAYYRRIFYYNTILNADMVAETATEEQQKQELLAKARVLRAYNYFDLVNKYAKAYNPASAASDLAILMPQTGDFEEGLKQSTVQEAYDFIVEDVLAAVDGLAEETTNYLHPNKAFGYGFLARVYLHMQKYDLALEAAEKSLALNDYIYDWVEFYNTNKDTPSWKWPKVELDYDENLLFAYGVSKFGLYYAWVTEDLYNQYESDDVRGIINFKNAPWFGPDVFYYSRSDDHNVGGMKSTEVRMIRAECNARKGNIAEAMADVNAFRQKRTIVEDGETYAALTATNTKEAMAHIMKQKKLEFFKTGILFLDLKRLNVEPEYATTLSKTIDDVTYTLKPESHLWIFPFAFSAMEKNDVLEQNTPR